MKKSIILLFVIGMVFTSCNNSGNENAERMIIASETADCVGVVPMDCYLIKREGQTDWEYFYDNIEGFTYEPGYEYVVEVIRENRENPAADQSIYRYKLSKEVSKERKTSENLPGR